MTSTPPVDLRERAARSDRFDPPGPLLAAMEVRALGERVQMTAALPALRRLPRGDGHPVVVFPGFTATDRSTEPLRRLLRELGYRTYGWSGGRNIGPTVEALEVIVRRLDHAYSREGRPVSLIGWSLGGIYARHLARAVPERVRQVITLGSPIQMIERDRSGAQQMWEAMRRYHAPGFVRTHREAFHPLLEVPATSIYTRSDGVVPWQASLIRRTDRTENIRVYGSHCGLGFNVAAIYAVADRLAQPEGQWTHFRAPLALRGCFPPTSDLDRDRLPGG